MLVFPILFLFQCLQALLWIRILSIGIGWSFLLHWLFSRLVRNMSTNWSVPATVHQGAHVLLARSFLFSWVDEHSFGDLLFSSLSVGLSCDDMNHVMISRAGLV